MAKTTLTFVPHGREAFGCELHTTAGHVLRLSGTSQKRESWGGSRELTSNSAVVENSWAFAVHEAAFRRLRSEEKRKSHRRQADHHQKIATSIADMAGALGNVSRTGWCSACFSLTTHTRVDGRWKWANTEAYLCRDCGAPTAKCMAPRCSNMANRNTGQTGLPRYCAEHRHDIPDFSKVDLQLKDLADFDVLFDWRVKDLATGTKVAITGAAAGAVVVPAAILAAPALGGILGASALGGSLSGAAATSHGLAMLGFGSLASGGLGMAGGTAVVAGAGAALGSTIGAITTSNYVGQDKSFRVEKLKSGRGAPVLLASGLFTEGTSKWSSWRPIVEDRWPDRPVYRIHWGSKELEALNALLLKGLGVKGGVVLAAKLATKATKTGAKRISHLGWLTAISDVASNPWSVALNRAGMTAAILADLIARTQTDKFVLVGHSLGARVMVQTAELLETKGSRGRIESVHLLGAAVPSKGDWRVLHESVAGGVWNYYSTNDRVLEILYKYAQLGSPAAGSRGFKTSYGNIHNVNVSRNVTSHSGYFECVRLK